MYEKLRRHLGKVVAGTAMAVTGSAIMVGVTLPGTAGADDTGGRATGTVRAEGENGPDAQGAPEPGTVASVPPAGAKGVGTDPLTDDELKRAEALALTPPARAAYRDVEGERGPQHLATVLAEPPPAEADAPAPPRRAEVRYYDYGRDELITRTVNLDTGKVESSRAQRGVQPSAHPGELREALQLILVSPLGKGVREDYKDATGKALTSPDQLWFNGDVYRTYREANVPAALAKCGEHRCVRLVTKIRNGSWIDTRNLIVDLSARTVTRVG
ncbi:Tat pathway signal sequence domain protein [Streptomyces solicathayae]|uniref:Tat pathway signal sequence domain protein n=1 Tax=Streptomyces solicathayae TaxID=3081768 RepID=A0ABZ0LPI8_9ACTN|nr:Tat pathway signal sequence domain protein [Streptomyces sp. HUAS YS2]WOX21413.1 Tat pathway signal sequence domain protein [Streptomyces sp. HUAS YS2]